MNGELSGRWYNQHGSQLDVEVDAGGRLRGTFRSGVGFPVAGEAFEVTGFVSGDLVGFTVSFGPHASVTSWSGHYHRESRSIETLWHMSVAVPGSSQDWKGIWSGADRFVRERPVEADELRSMRSHPTRQND